MSEHSPYFLLPFFTGFLIIDPNAVPLTGGFFVPFIALPLNTKPRPTWPGQFQGVVRPNSKQDTTNCETVQDATAQCWPVMIFPTVDLPTPYSAPAAILDIPPSTRCLISRASCRVSFAVPLRSPRAARPRSTASCALSFAVPGRRCSGLTQAGLSPGGHECNASIPFAIAPL